MNTKLLIVFAAIFLSLFSPKSYAQSFDYKENAVYILNFIKYTNWSSKKTVIEVGIVGNSPIEDELRILFSKKKNSGVSYNIKKTGADQAAKCDVLIVTNEASDKLKSINEATKKSSILIITEKANMGRFGACISFFINEDENYKTEYQLSIKNCKERGLIIGEQIKNNAELMR